MGEQSKVKASYRSVITTTATPCECSQLERARTAQLAIVAVLYRRKRSDGESSMQIEMSLLINNKSVCRLCGKESVPVGSQFALAGVHLVENHFSNHSLHHGDGGCLEWFNRTIRSMSVNIQQNVA